MSVYGLIIGFCLALVFGYFSRHNYAVPKNQEGTFLALLSFFCLLGARAYHVVDQWRYYGKDLFQIVNTRAGGLGIFGALLGGLLFVFLYSLFTHIYFADIVDALIPVVPLCQALGRLGNFLNHEGFGIPTYSSWGQYVPLKLRPVQFQLYSRFHPVWFYEAVLCFILYLILRRVNYHQVSYYFIGYGLIRFATEFFRFDTWVFNGIKVAHVLSLVFILIGSVVLVVDKFGESFESKVER